MERKRSGICDIGNQFFRFGGLDVEFIRNAQGEPTGLFVKHVSAIIGLHANEVGAISHSTSGSLNRAQLWCSCCAASVLFIDGFDAQSIGFVAPA